MVSVSKVTGKKMWDKHPRVLLWRVGSSQRLRRLKEWGCACSVARCRGSKMELPPFLLFLLSHNRSGGSQETLNTHSEQSGKN